MPPSPTTNSGGANHFKSSASKVKANRKKATSFANIASSAKSANLTAAEMAKVRIIVIYFACFFFMIDTT